MRSNERRWDRRESRTRTLRILIVLLAPRPSGFGQFWRDVLDQTAVYPESEEVKAEAQHFWSASAVHSLYQEGKFRWARYGFEEVETRYIRRLGELDDPEEPGAPTPNREEHMAECAMRETLAFALDVDGFREVLGLAPDDVMDDRLLTALHEVRTRSTRLPEGK